MLYKLFGRSGLRVSELCLGTLTFGNDWHDPTIGATIEESRAIFDAFADAGGNFIDTASLYRYRSITGEQLVGDFIRADRDHFVISTKYALSLDNDLAKSGGSRKNMMRSINESLRRLKVEYIDVYWLHIWDNSVPIEEVLRGLDDLITCGKINYIAISDSPAWLISRATTMSELRGWARFCGIQVEYNLLARTAERELLPMAKHLELAVCAWSPLARGRLSGKNIRTDESDATRGIAEANGDRVNAIVQKVSEIAAELGCTSSQVALAAIRKLGGRSIIPIIGARTVAQIRENIDSLRISLDESHLSQLLHISAIEPGFPDTLPAGVQALAYGGKAGLLA